MAKKWAAVFGLPGAVRWGPWLGLGLASIGKEVGCSPGLPWCGGVGPMSVAGACGCVCLHCVSHGCLHAALHGCLCMLMLQMMMPNKGCIDVTMR